MPRLKQLSCSLELGGSNIALKEHDTWYRDGAVDCFIAAPELDIPFSISIIPTGYIAQGIAAFVYIDGDYQCNRNTACGQESSGLVEDIGLRLRQQEQKMADGSFIGRDWRFARLMKAQSGHRNRHFEQNVGKIEVIILRCRYDDIEEQPRPAKTALEPAKPDNTKLKPVLTPQKQAAANTKPASTKPLSLKKASIKAASQASVVGSLGLLGGLFDGAGDSPPRRRGARQATAPIYTYPYAQPATMAYQPTPYFNPQYMPNPGSPMIWQPPPDALHTYVPRQKYKTRHRSRHNQERSRSHRHYSDSSSTDSSSDDSSESDSKQSQQQDNSSKSTHRSTKTRHRHRHKKKSRSKHSHHQKNDQTTAGAGWGDTNNDNANAHNNNDNSNNDATPLTWGLPDNNEAVEKAVSIKVTTANKSSSTKASSSAYDNTSTTSKLTIQSYWADWDKSGSPTAAEGRLDRVQSARPAYTYSALPPPAVLSKSKIEADCGVQIGKGASYGHKIRRPVYIDSIEAPYAVFTFHYSSREKLEERLGRSIRTEDKELVANAEREQLLGMSKSQMVEELLKLKGGIGTSSQQGANTGFRRSVPAQSVKAEAPKQEPTHNVRASEREKSAAIANWNKDVKPAVEQKASEKGGFKEASLNGAMGAFVW